MLLIRRIFEDVHEKDEDDDDDDDDDDYDYDDYDDGDDDDEKRNLSFAPGCSTSISFKLISPWGPSKKSFGLNLIITIAITIIIIIIIII
eukprot:8178040-Karenia_brevis.AAC.1